MSMMMTNKTTKMILVRQQTTSAMMCRWWSGGGASLSLSCSSSFRPSSRPSSIHSQLSFFSTRTEPSTSSAYQHQYHLQYQHPQLKQRVHVHPLSKIVLQCLQTHHHDWIMKQNLHHSCLKTQRDGSFTLTYPTKSQTVGNGTSQEESPPARIWTYYDPMGKKYWLLYGSKDFQYQFLLHDNFEHNILGSASKNSSSSSNGVAEEESSALLTKEIHESVNDLVRTINEIKYTVRIK